MTAEDIEKKSYELAVLLKDEESGREVLKLVGQHNIEVRETGQLKKISLAYPIKRASLAYFGYSFLLAAPSDIKSLEHDLRSSPHVLRSMIMVPPRDNGRAQGTFERRRPQVARRPPPSSFEAKPRPQQAALSNEAIEKKIEEILK